MALVVADRIKETTTTTGTGTYTLAGAVLGFEAFSSIGDGNTTYYCCTDGTDFEVGIGTYTSSGTTLARTTILQSSNSDSAVNWTAGERTIFVTQPAEKAVYLDASGYIAAFDGRNLTNVDAETLDSINSTSFLRNDNGDISVGSNKITGLATPTANTDAATKAYVDSLVSTAIHIHDPVRVERPDGDGNLAGTYNNGTAGVGATLTNNSTQVALSIDGVTLSTSDRVLLYNQTDATENGVYTVTNTGSASTNWVLTRATDADSSGIGTSDALDEGSYFYVEEGNTGAGESYVCNVSGTITFGTTNITFAKFGESVSYTGGTGIDINVRDIVLDLSELTTSTSDGDGDFFAVVDSSNNQKKLTKANINLSGFNNDSGFLTEVSNLTLSNFAGSTIQLSSESFSDVDTALMTAAAIDDRILSFGYTTNVGDITGVTAGTGLTGGGSSGTVSLSLDGTGTVGAGTYGSTSDLTKIDTITVDAFGRVTAVATGNTGDGGNAATLDSLDSTQFLRSDVADTMSANLTIADDTSLYIGTGGDLEIQHNSGNGNSRIRESGSGGLYIDATNLYLRGSSPNFETYAQFIENGAVELYYDNSKKFETTDTGVQITSFDPSANEEPTLDLYRNSASPADGDVLGNIDFSGEDSAGNKTVYAKINSDIIDQTDGTEDGRIEIFVMSAGAQQNRAVFQGNSTTRFVNRDVALAQNIDLIFEGATDDDNETTLTVVDPTADRTITLPDASGTVLLDTGNQTITGDLTLTSTDSGSAEDPTLKLYRNSATPTGGDNIGHIQFTGNNASGTEVVLAEIESVLGGTTAGSEEGRMRLKVRDGGTEFTVIEIGYDRVQFNEGIFINNGNGLNFEGSNADNFETELNATEPTQDNIINLPDASGTVLLDAGNQSITGDLTLTSTDGGATEDPTLDLYRNSASPANNDVLGHILFSGETSTGNKVQYAEIESRIVDVTNGSEDGRLVFRYLNNGSSPAVIDMSFGRIAVYQDIKLQVDQDLYFQGSTDDSNETQLTVADPTADRTITLPDATGTVLLKDANDDVIIEGTDAGSGADPTLVLYRNSASPASFDNLGKIEFKGNNSSGTETTYFYAQAQASDETTGSEDGVLRFYHTIGGNPDRLVAEMGYSALVAYGQMKINASANYTDPSLVFEGATTNSFETTVRVVDPTQDNIITLPNASGNVPVFTTAPTGAITDGTDGQVLTTDGAGALSFTTVSSGSSDANYFDAFNTDTQSFTGTDTGIDFDTIRYNSDGSVFTESAGEVTVNASGFHRISFDVSTSNNTGTVRCDSIATLQRKPSGGSFSDVAGSEAHMYNRTNTVGENTGSLSIVYNITSGDTYRVVVRRVNGSNTLATIANGCRFNIVSIGGTQGAQGPQGVAGDNAYDGINAQTGTSYTAVAADEGKLITLNNASAITFTIPPNSSVAYAVGVRLDIAQFGLGQVTVAGGSGVTVNSTPTLKLRARYSAASCVKIATDEWLLVGDLAET